MWQGEVQQGRRTLSQLPGLLTLPVKKKKKSGLMHSINLIKQAPLAHYLVKLSRAPSCHARRSMPGQLNNHRAEIQKQWRGLLKTRRTLTRSMFCFLALRRHEELCSLLSFSWSLDYTRTGYAEILKQAGKGARSMQNILLYGNESTMWQLLNSSESPKQMLLLMAREEVFTASKSKSNTYLCLYSVSRTLFLFSLLPPPSVKRSLRRELFLAWAD